MLITKAILLKLLIFCLIIISLIIAYLLIEVVRLVMPIRRMANRIELMTDIKEWLHFLRKLPKSRKK